ncbi:Porin B [Methylovirgula sp. HY1]|nr:Porin B [Methylovirgula sp. HY1]
MEATLKILTRRRTSVSVSLLRANLFQGVVSYGAYAARLGLAAACLNGFGGGCALAQETSGSTPPKAGSEETATEPNFMTGLFASSRSTLLGDMWGLRSALGTYGLTLGIQDTNEGFGNATGGIKQGANYDGLTLMTLGLDTKKAFGLDGGSFNISALQIRGRNLSSTNLLDLQTFSGIAAQPSTRLWELWYQQTFLGGKMDVKVGQQSLDQEFMTSQGSNLFINTMMGWPMLPSADLYAGGPAYPLSSLGARLRGQPFGPVTVLAGVFQDNPAGGPFNDDSQTRGSSAWGGNFLHMNTGALFISEVQYAVNQPSAGDMDDGHHSGGLPGTYKLGAWFDTAAFPSQRYDTAGLSLANPASNGVAAMVPNNFSIYAIMDQMLWRPSADGQQALGVFARIMGAPGDRNLISFSANGGVTLKAPLAGRDNDSFGVGFGVTQVGNAVSNLDQEAVYYAGTSMPVRSTESFVEATYQYQVAPWWQLQPDFQYVIRPGGGIPNPYYPSALLGNEAVFGLRSVVTF